MVFRFRTDIQSENCWGFDILHKKFCGEGDFFVVMRCFVTYWFAQLPEPGVFRRGREI